MRKLLWCLVSFVVVACGSSTAPSIHPVLVGAVVLLGNVVPVSSTTADAELLGLATTDNLDPNGTYVVFYVDGNPPQFLLRATVDQTSHNAVAPHMHFTATSGVLYHFRVCAVNSHNQESSCDLYGTVQIELR